MEYTKCLVELDEVLKHLADKDLGKIPLDIRQTIEKNKNKQYNWNYDEDKKLSEQNIDRKTIAMLSYLSMEYLVNENQKQLMEKIHKINEENAEKEKLSKYNLDNLFNHNLKSNQEEMALVEIKNEKWYKKIISFIKHIFYKK